jgi:CelD/BcsL family acetyltransferase involved in cellulose biosynthesis
LVLDGTWEEFKKRSKSERKKVAKSIRRLNKFGKIHCDPCNSRDIVPLLNDLFVLHKKRWNSSNTSSQFNQEAKCDFYREVTPLLNENGMVQLFQLTVDGLIIAVVYLFNYGNKITGQLLAFNPEFSKGSPAIVMIELMLKRLFGGKYLLFDFGDYYPYKKIWGNRYKHKYKLHVYPKRILPMLMCALSELQLKAWLILDKTLQSLQRTVCSLFKTANKNL